MAIIGAVHRSDGTTVCGGVTATDVTAIESDVTVADGADLAVGSTTGTKIATASTQKLGFFGVTPVVQPSALTQTYSTADATLATPAATAVATTGATAVTPFGFTTAAQADDIVTQLNALRSDQLDLAQFVNSLVDKLQALGLLA